VKEEQGKRASHCASRRLDAKQIFIADTGAAVNAALPRGEFLPPGESGIGDGLDVAGGEDRDRRLSLGIKTIPAAERDD